MAATAPYNFIRFVPPVTAEQLNGTGFALPPLDVQIPEFNSGYIEYTLTTLSPLHIGPGTESLVTPDGKHFWIPGSAVRGMLRAVLEVVLGSDLDEPVLKTQHDQAVFYRAPLAANAEYKNAYWRARGTTMNDQRVGLLRRTEDGGYTVEVGQRYKVHRDALMAYRDSIGTLAQGRPRPLRARLDATRARELQFGEIWFVADPAGKAIRVDASEFPGARRGWLLITGVFDNTTAQKHAYIVSEAAGATNLHLAPSVVTDYAQSRTDHADELLPDFDRYFKDHPGAPIPVFFDTEGSSVTRVGTAGGFRIKARGNRYTSVPALARARRGALLAVDALLGRIAATPDGDDVHDRLPTVAGRVHVGHAFADYDADRLLSPQRVRLESPKMTATHLRLRDASHPGELRTFDDEVVAYRGRTTYLHRWTAGGSDELTWQAAVNEHKAGAPANAAPADAPEFRPIRTKTEFAGRIIFRNLTDAEFGALVFALRLWNQPDRDFTHAHKIGGLRPLGLGSVGIRFTAILVDPEERYSGGSGLSVQEPASVAGWWAGFLRRFVGPDSPQSLAVRDLERACRWAGRLPREATRQMTVDDHARRELLPTIHELFPS